MRSHASASGDTCTMSGLGRSKGSDDDMGTHVEGRIKVVTVLAQSMESTCDGESQRGLVWKETEMIS